MRKAAFGDPILNAEATARFWAKVNKFGPAPAELESCGPCWLWLGTLELGYGRFYFGHRGQYERVHRLAYFLTVGLIEDDLELDHLCRVRHCCNPQHLEPVTHAENIRRGRTGAHNADKTHCNRGHEYTEKNTLIHFPRGYPSRLCRICENDRKRAHYAANRIQELAKVRAYRAARRKESLK